MICFWHWKNNSKKPAITIILIQRNLICPSTQASEIGGCLLQLGFSQVVFTKPLYTAVR